MATTPTSRRSRLRSRPNPSNVSPPGPGLPQATSTPSHSSPDRPGQRRGSMDFSAMEVNLDDSDDIPLSSQHQPKPGEVFWNYDASPKTKEKLRTALAQVKYTSAAADVAAFQAKFALLGRDQSSFDQNQQRVSNQTTERLTKSEEKLQTSKSRSQCGGIDQRDARCIRQRLKGGSF